MSGLSNHNKSPKLRRNQRIYNIWSSMKYRCDKPTCKEYKWYGARGINYDPRWVKFENFQADMQENYNDNLTLERIDNNKGYSKENCKWILLIEQAKNTRNIEKAVKITFRGQTLRIREWAEKLGMKRETLSRRILDYNWPIERAFGEGVHTIA